MFYIALSVLLIYLLIIFIKYKQIPTSLSETFYIGANWWFTAILWIIGFATASSLISITPESYQFLGFLTGAGLLFVGAAPHFKEEFEGKIHYGGAYIFGIASQIWAVLQVSPYLLLTWLLFAMLITTKQRVFWAEMVCVINLIIAYALS